MLCLSVGWFVRSREYADFTCQYYYFIDFRDSDFELCFVTTKLNSYSCVILLVFGHRHNFVRLFIEILSSKNFIFKQFVFGACV